MILRSTVCEKTATFVNWGLRGFLGLPKLLRSRVGNHETIFEAIRTAAGVAENIHPDTGVQKAKAKPGKGKLMAT
jgi:hypothetical protein